MPGQAANTYTKYLFWHTADITDGDFSVTGTLLGKALPSSDTDGSAEVVTDESADGPVGVGADLSQIWRFEAESGVVSTLQTAKGARTEGYIFAVSPSLDGYTSYGPGRIAAAYEPGAGTERQLPHSMFQFVARGDEPEDLIRNVTSAVTLP